jgi:recombination protein RecT
MNAVAPQQKKKFSLAIQSEGYQNLIKNTLRDPARINRFIGAISSVVATNSALQECESGSILSSALLGEALNLSPSPQLGQYYMVPFKRKANVNKGITEAMLAQFVLGYKGYLQLAIRSGFYVRINVLDIKAGELIRFNPLREEIEVNLIGDELDRESAETVGYYAMFEYNNGFRKELYWTKNKMLLHADRYSAAFNKDIYLKLQRGEPIQNDWKYSSFWYKDFDGMAFKTMLRQLISKWGIMSTEMTEAFTKDGMTATSTGEFDYIDGDSIEVGPENKEQSNDTQPEKLVYSQESFEKNKAKWRELIITGKKSPAAIIKTVESNSVMTDEQKLELDSYFHEKD